jgi:tricorn protease
MHCSLVASAVMLVSVSSVAFGGVDGLYRFPTTNGQTVVFAAEGDLWKVPIEGGMAMRLTTDAGEEAFPKFSMDGSWVAFSAEIEGNVDVYAMPIDRAGEPVRLTFHPAADIVVAWTPEGRVVFRSMRSSANWGENRLFTVSPEGDTPAMVPIGLAALADYSEDGSRIAYTRTSWEFATWKRYKGGTAQDVWVANLRDGSFEQLTDYEGTDRFPMWHAGRVYFVSDRNGRMNLFSMAADGSDVRQLTHHDDYDADWPDMHGGVIVYTVGADVWTYDVASERNVRVAITLPTDRLETRTRFENPAETLEGYDLSKDGSRVLVCARGEMWNVPVKGGRTVEVTRSSGVREREGSFSPDGKRIAAITDASGSQEIALFDSVGKDAEKTLTNLGLGWVFRPVWSPDGKKIAFADLEQRLHVLDVESGALDTVAVTPGWEITSYVFSPDSAWLAFTKPREWGWASELVVYNVGTKAMGTVSTEFTGDHSPAWDPSGKYLYFVSSRRYDPIWCWRDFNHVTVGNEVICAAILQADGVSPLLSKEALELFGAKDKKKDEDKDEKKDEAKDESKKDGDAPAAEGAAEAAKDGEKKDEEKPVEPVVVDLDGLAQRVVELPMPAGNYSGLVRVSGKLLYTSRPVVGQVTGSNPAATKATIHAFDFDTRESSVFLAGVDSFDISDDGSKIAWREGGPIKIAGTAAAPTKPDHTVDPASLRLEVHPREEWVQIFWEAWRLQRDFYWAPNMAGLDWESVGAAYAALLPRVGSRDELNWLIGQMIGELGTSHTYIWGGDAEQGKSVSVGLLGADVEADAASGFHRITRVLRPSAWETDVVSPLAQTHARVADGSYLFAVNHRDVPATENLWRVLQNMAGREVMLTIGTNADRSDARDVQVVLMGSEHQLRYCDWVRTRREIALEQSSGRIGYIHLPDMGTEGLVEFIEAFYPQVHKDALIIDCRYNGGGNVSQMVMDRLSREVWAFMKPRRNDSSTYPAQTHMGPKVLLTNYFAGSDGDIGPQSFRLLGIGPIIGTRSWGGVVGIRSDKPFIDGGMSTQPEFAWWEPEAGWTLENRGVDPDVTLDILPPDSAAGNDPQLDAAIAHLMEELSRNPSVRPQPPAFPDKRMQAAPR